MKKLTRDRVVPTFGEVLSRLPERSGDLFHIAHGKIQSHQTGNNGAKTRWLAGAGGFEPRHRCGHAGQRKGVAHMLTQKFASLLRWYNEGSRSDGKLSAGTTSLCAAGEDPYRHV
jgi:hypothetical protein